MQSHSATSPIEPDIPNLLAKLAAIRFPRKQLPEIFDAILDPDGMTPTLTAHQEKLLAGFQEYVDKQVHLHELSQANEDIDPKTLQTMIDEISHLVIDLRIADLQIMLNPPGLAILLTPGMPEPRIAINKESVTTLNGLLSIWKKNPALHYLDPLTGHPVVTLDPVTSVFKPMNRSTSI